MSEPLIIVGAGGHGRETAFTHLLRAPTSGLVGFLDDRVRGSTPEGWPVLGTIDDAVHHARAHFVLAINDPRARRVVAHRLIELGVTRWGSVMHPDVRLHPSVRRGIGCSILGGSQLTTNIRIGDHCILNRGSQVSHDCQVGHFCSLNPGACVAGNVTVDDGCELGSACAIRQGCRIEHGATVGMGAVVLRDVSRNSVMVGNPARTLRSNDPW